MISRASENHTPTVWQLENTACMLGVQPHQVRQMPAGMLVHFPVLEHHDFATIKWLHAIIEGTDNGNEKCSAIRQTGYINSRP